MNNKENKNLFVVCVPHSPLLGVGHNTYSWGEVDPTYWLNILYKSILIITSPDLFTDQEVRNAFDLVRYYKGAFHPKKNVWVYSSRVHVPWVINTFPVNKKCSQQMVDAINIARCLLAMEIFNHHDQVKNSIRKCKYKFNENDPLWLDPIWRHSRSKMEYVFSELCKSVSVEC